MSGKLKVNTPEILWHGGGAENGKPDPVFSIDFHPYGILASSGIDDNLPPKGSVRLWRISSTTDEKEFLFELNDHATSVNCVKFSSCGKMLATGSDRTIIIYSVSDPNLWSKLDDVRNIERQWLSPNLEEIYDIQWSPDCAYIIAGSINSKAEIIKIQNRDTISLTGHSSYVQGVAWDPLNQLVVTLSADRSCKFHMIKTTKVNNTVKLAPKGHSVLRMSENTKHLFAHDSAVNCFFRRPTFSPDGSLIFLPTGVYRQGLKPENDAKSQSFCSYILSRSQLSSPIICLAGLDEPSVAIRCSPVLYKLMEHGSEPMIKGNYRFVFAVATISSIFIYDTQHPHPIAKVAGCHLAAINDLTWSADGNLLLACSSDGYVTFIRFPPGLLGEPLSKEDVPLAVKRAMPCYYGYDGNEGVDDSPKSSQVLPMDIDNPKGIERDCASIIDLTSADINQEPINIDSMDIVQDYPSNNITKDINLRDLCSVDESAEYMELSPSENNLKSFKLANDAHISSPSNFSDSSIIGVSLLRSDHVGESSPSKRIKMIHEPLTSKNIINSKYNVDSQSPSGESKVQDTLNRPLANVTNPEVKVKKRIAPILISPFVSSSYSSSSSSSKME